MILGQLYHPDIFLYLYIKNLNIKIDIFEFIN